MDLDSVADELYGLPPSDFIPVRNDRSAAAAAAGDAGLAREIKALRRPTAGAVLLNAIARYHAAALDDLLGIGDQASVAQEAGSGADLRDLLKRRQVLLAELLGAATSLASEYDVSAGQGVMRDLQGVLLLASGDPSVATVLKAGRLSAVPSQSAAVDPSPAPEPRSRPARIDPAIAKRHREAQRKVARSEAEVTKREAQLRRARDDDAHLQRRITQLRHELDGLEEAKHKAEHLIAAAETAVAHAKETLAEHRRELRG